MTDYHKKYIKYKTKYLELKNILSGGEISDISDVEEIIKQKGNNFWYNSHGKLLVNAKSDKQANREILRIINSYVDEDLINVKIIIWTDNESVPAPIEISIKVLTVKEIIDKIALNLRDDQHSMIRIFLNPEEFNLSDIKKLAKVALDGKLDDDVEYTYDDIKKYIRKN